MMDMKGIGKRKEDTGDRGWIRMIDLHEKMQEELDYQQHKRNYSREIAVSEWGKLQESFKSQIFHVMKTSVDVDGN